MPIFSAFCFFLTLRIVVLHFANHAESQLFVPVFFIKRRKTRACTHTYLLNEKSEGENRHGISMHNTAYSLIYIYIYKPVQIKTNRNISSMYLFTDTRKCVRVYPRAHHENSLHPTECIIALHCIALYISTIHIHGSPLLTCNKVQSDLFFIFISALAYCIGRSRLCCQADIFRYCCCFDFQHCLLHFIFAMGEKMGV